MTGGAPRNQTGESPESNRGIPGIKPGALRNQTGRSPESNRAIPGIKPAILFQDFHQKNPATAKLRQIWLKPDSAHKTRSVSSKNPAGGIISQI